MRVKKKINMNNVHKTRVLSTCLEKAGGTALTTFTKPASRAEDESSVKGRKKINNKNNITKTPNFEHIFRKDWKNIINNINKTTSYAGLLMLLILAGSMVGDESSVKGPINMNNIENINKTAFSSTCTRKTGRKTLTTLTNPRFSHLLFIHYV